MRERLESVESTVDDIPQKVSGLAEEMVRLSERVYGVEDRLDAMVSKLDITTESLRADFRLAFERLDGLKQLIERKAAESQAGRAADQSLLYAPAPEVVVALSAGFTAALVFCRTPASASPPSHAARTRALQFFWRRPSEERRSWTRRRRSVFISQVAP